MMIASSRIGLQQSEQYGVDSQALAPYSNILSFLLSRFETLMNRIEYDFIRDMKEKSLWYVVTLCCPFSDFE